MKVLSCIQFDEATNTCLQQDWAESSILPPLSIADANSIGVAYLLILAMAFGARAIFSLIFHSGANRSS